MTQFRWLQWGLLALGAAALLTGAPMLSALLLLSGVACFVVVRPGSRASDGSRSASPLASSFDMTPTPGGVDVRFTVRPARGKAPLTTVPGFIGAAGAAVGALLLVGHRFPYNPSDSQWVLIFLIGVGVFLMVNWLLHRPAVLAYRTAVAAPNLFEVGPQGIRVQGELLTRSSLFKLRLENPLTQNRRDGSALSTGMVAGGSGVIGAAMGAGGALGSGIASATVLQAESLRARTALHAWVLVVVDTRGQTHRLAGGMTDNTAEALAHAVEQHL